jgi:DNA invertase Pin-like site-specific DNA recombinase
MVIAVTYGLDSAQLHGRQGARAHFPQIRCRCSAQLHGLPGCVCVTLFCVMIVFYARVSTTEQTTAHQRTQAEQAGFKIDKVVADEGISGVNTTLAERPEGKRLFDMLRSGDTLVVRWVGRLGRNYTDVVDAVREFMRHGVIIKTVINGMTFDGSTTDPMQQAVRDALIAFMAATAQAQAAATKSAQRAGIDHKRRARIPETQAVL